MRFGTLWARFWSILGLGAKMHKPHTHRSVMFCTRRRCLPSLDVVRVLVVSKSWGHGFAQITHRFVMFCIKEMVSLILWAIGIVRVVVVTKSVGAMVLHKSQADL